MKTFAKKQLLEWSFFAVISLLTCVLFAVRPIPSIDSSNDTGRYVSELHGYCAGDLTDVGLQNRQLSFEIFYFFTSPSCLIRSNEFFLFLVAAFVPLMFLVFSSWKNGTFFWACSLLFSVYGIELMTNAMRQGLAMLLFFGGISVLRQNKKFAFLLCFLACAAHTSALGFMPLILWLSGMQVNIKTMFILWSLFIPSVLAFFIFRGSALLEFYDDISSLAKFYDSIYEQSFNTLFILFIILPLYFVYGLRYILDSKFISSYEKKSFLYSNLLLLMAMVLYPAIAYRFAIFAIPLQVFLVAMSNRPGLRVGALVFIGMSIHLLAMLVLSDNYLVLLYG